MRTDHRNMLNEFFRGVSSKGEPMGVIPVAVSRMGEEFEPEIKLIAAVMESSIYEKDKKYIYNGGLQVACKVLHLNYKKVKYMFKDMHRIINNKIEWSK